MVVFCLLLFHNQMTAMTPKFPQKGFFKKMKNTIAPGAETIIMLTIFLFQCLLQIIDELSQSIFKVKLKF